jgi:hypothetical protein
MHAVSPRCSLPKRRAQLIFLAPHIDEEEPSVFSRSGHSVSSYDGSPHIAGGCPII